MTMNELIQRAHEAEQLAACLLDYAARLKSRSRTAEEPRLFWPETQILSQAATSNLALRARRSKYMDTNLFGELAWDIMLALFNASLAAKELTFEQVFQSGKPCESTARRWLAILVGRKLVEGLGELQDGHSQCYRLTERGLMQMMKIFLEDDEAQPEQSRQLLDGQG